MGERILLTHSSVHYGPHLESARSEIESVLKNKELGHLAHFTAPAQNGGTVTADLVASIKGEGQYTITISAQKEGVKGAFDASSNPFDRDSYFLNEQTILALFLTTCRALVDGVSPEHLPKAARRAQSDLLLHAYDTSENIQFVFAQTLAALKYIP